MRTDGEGTAMTKPKTGDRVTESSQSAFDDGLDNARQTRAGKEDRADRVFSQTYPALPRSVAVVRAKVGDLAEQAGAGRSTVDAVKLAVSEAATNVVVHAYRDADEHGLIHLEATLVSGELRVSVADTGSGLQSRRAGPGLGLGLVIIGKLADSVELLQGGGGGVTVLMRFALGTGGS